MNPLARIERIWDRTAQALSIFINSEINMHFTDNIEQLWIVFNLVCSKMILLSNQFYYELYSNIRCTLCSIQDNPHSKYVSLMESHNLEKIENWTQNIHPDWLCSRSACPPHRYFILVSRRHYNDVEAHPFWENLSDQKSWKNLVINNLASDDSIGLNSILCMYSVRWILFWLG